MGATGTKLDRKASIEAQALAAVRQLLQELGGKNGLEELNARGTRAHLERELGLGSLERVELMLRLSKACGTHLSEDVVADADTIQDLINAIVEEGSPASVARAGTPAAAVAADSESRSRHPDLEKEVRGAATLTEILRLRARAEPDRVHIQLYEQDEQPHAITFGELYERASTVSAELLRRGLEPQQTVAIMLPTCADFFYSFAGILLAGGIPVPIYPPFRANRIAEYATRQANILRNAEARFLLTFRQAEGLARVLRPRVPTLREVLNAERLSKEAVGQTEPVSSQWRPAENIAHHARAEDIAFLQYTSGSTGDPKGVTLTHANLIANMRSILQGADVRPEDVAVSWLPLYHDMGLIGAWLTPLLSGNPVVIMSPLAFLGGPDRWLWAIHRHRGTLSPAPNFAYELCVRKIEDQDVQGLDLSSWRAALNGAETVRAETLERFAAKFAPYGFRREALLPVYGLAEASLAVSMPRIGSGYKVDRIERDAFESDGRAVSAAAGDSATLDFVSAGRPLPNVAVRVVMKDGSDAGERSEGELWFRSPSATSGYYRNPAATKELLREGGWLNSGDLAYLAEGEIYITGRAKDMIIKAGRNLYPHEIEDIAGRVAGVRAGCVVAFGAPDARSGTEKLVVAAEVRNMAEARRISAEIGRAVSDDLGVPPDRIEILPSQSIPKTSSGKLRRGETRRLFLEGKLGKKPPPAWMQAGMLAVRSALPRAWARLKSGLTKAIEFLYGVYVLALFGAFLIALWLCVLLTRDRRRAARLVRGAARVMLSAAGISVRVVGGETLNEPAKSGPWIFTPNHSSYLDILVILAILPPSVRFVAKEEVDKMPLVGAITRRTGHFLFDRNDPQARMQQMEDVNAALARGESVAIYPEGTFTQFTGIRPFQLGAFKAAVDTQRPICPVAVRGARKILPDQAYLPRFGKVTVTLGPLMTPEPDAGNDWREIIRLRDETREIIARNAGESLL